jgi:hypothetical protein
MGAGNERFHVLLGPRPGERDRRRAQRKSGGKAVFIEVEEKEIQRECLVGPLPDRRRPGSNLVRAHVVAAHGSKPARARHGGHQVGRIDRSHASERNRVLDIQQVANRRPDHAVPPSKRRGVRGTKA